MFKVREEISGLLSSFVLLSGASCSCRFSSVVAIVLKLCLAIVHIFSTSLQFGNSWIPFVLLCFPYQIFSGSQASSKCRKCRLVKPRWDPHDLCPFCRSCTDTARCAICREWTEEWIDLLKWKEEKEKRRNRANSSSSTRSKDKEASAPAKQTVGSAIAVLTDVGSRPTMSLSHAPPLHTSSSQISPTPPTATAAAAPVMLHTCVHAPVTSCLETHSSSGQVYGHAPVASFTDSHRSSVSPEVIDPGSVYSQSASSQPIVLTSAHNGLDILSVPGPSGLNLSRVDSRPVSALSNILQSSEAVHIANREEDVLSTHSIASQSPDRRSRPRHRRSHKDKRHHRHSSSSSVSSRSPSPRRKRKRVAQDSNSQALSQILSLLTNLTQPLRQEHSQAPIPSQPVDQELLHAHDIVTDTPVTSVPLPDQDITLPFAQVPPLGEGQLDSSHSGEGAELLSVLDSHVSGEHHNDSSSEDEPLYGTDIPKEVFAKAVGILRTQLGFEPQSSELPPSQSKLSLNKPTRPTKASLPVDVECEDRYKASASAKKWSPYPRVQSSSFRVDEKEWRKLFRTPDIPQSAMDYLRSVGSADSSGKLSSQTIRQRQKSFRQVDAAARTGLKYASAMLLIAEVISKSFQTSEVSRKDTATLVCLLGPLARRLFDQFSRISVKAVSEQRDAVLEAMRLPQKDIIRRFAQLPLSGEDLFGGLFDSQLQTEVKRRKDMMKANLSRPRQRPSSRAGNTLPRPFVRPAQSATPSGSRPRSSAPPQRRPSRPSTSSTRQSKNSFRGSKSSRGRGFSRP